MQSVYLPAPRLIRDHWMLVVKIRCVLIRHEILSKNFFNSGDGIGNEKCFGRSRIEKPIQKETVLTH